MGGGGGGSDKQIDKRKRRGPSIIITYFSVLLTDTLLTGESLVTMEIKDESLVIVQTTGSVVGHHGHDVSRWLPCI